VNRFDAVHLRKLGQLARRDDHGDSVVRVGHAVQHLRPEVSALQPAHDCFLRVLVLRVLRLARQHGGTVRFRVCVRNRGRAAGHLDHHRHGPADGGL
jgi:hypothetical protein